MITCWVNCSYFSFLFDISAGGLLIPEGITRPLVSISKLTWFITYIFIIGNYRSYIFKTSGLKLS